MSNNQSHKDQLLKSISDAATHFTDMDLFDQLSDEAIEREFELDEPPYSQVSFFPLYRYDRRAYYLCKHNHETMESARACVAHLEIPEKDLEIAEVRSKWLSMTVGCTVHTHKDSNSSGEIFRYISHHTRFHPAIGYTLQEIRDRADKRRAANREKYGKKDKLKP